ncbi:MAG TPA: hypothetical protein VM434_11765 [Beijerinckiaceae bacterium]|nr:hypothetical protein [Beijerinckiaceae bacterium]
MAAIVPDGRGGSRPAAEGGRRLRRPEGLDAPRTVPAIVLPSGDGAACAGSSVAPSRAPPPTRRGRRKVEPGLAAWMARAGLPRDAIATAFKASESSVELALRQARIDEAAAERVARLAAARAARHPWCPPARIPDYQRLAVLLCAATARALVEADAVERFDRLRARHGAARAAAIALAGRRA